MRKGSLFGKIYVRLSGCLEACRRYGLSVVLKLSLPCILCFSLAGCLETEVSLSGDDYKLIDSLYTKQKDSLIPVMDSACVRFKDSVMQHWVDSIMTERQEEIDKLIGR